MAKLSYKVSYYALYVMFAIILVVLGMFFFGGDAQGDAVLMSVDSEIFDWFGYIGCSCCYFLDYG